MTNEGEEPNAMKELQEVVDSREPLEVTNKESDQRSVEPEEKFSDEAHQGDQGELQKVEEIPAKSDKKPG